MLFALLAAGLASHHPSTVEGRVSLLEAKEMMESRELWSLRSDLPPEALRLLNDVNLHVQHDQEQDDKVRELSATVQTLEQRLLALETMLQDRPMVEGRIPVAPMTVAPIVVSPRARLLKAQGAPKPQTRKGAGKSAIGPQQRSAAARAGASGARLAEVP